MPENPITPSADLNDVLDEDTQEQPPTPDLGYARIPLGILRTTRKAQ